MVMTQEAMMMDRFLRGGRLTLALACLFVFAGPVDRVGADVRRTAAPGTAGTGSGRAFRARDQPGPPSGGLGAQSSRAADPAAGFRRDAPCAGARAAIASTPAKPCWP